MATTPTTVEQLKYDYYTDGFNRIQWRNGQKPALNEDNLNRIEVALTKLLPNLNSDVTEGYIPNIINILNQEIIARITDIQLLIDSDVQINNLITNIQQNIQNIELTINELIEADEVINNKIDQSVTQLTQIITELNEYVDIYINSNNNNITNIQSNITSILTYIETLEKNILVDINTTINNNTTEINLLKQRVTNIENDSPEIPENIISESDKLILYCGTASTVLHAK